MKRLLSLVLVVAMVLGMTVTVSAAGKITAITKPIASNNNPDLSTISPGRTVKYPLTADMFSWSDGSTGSKSTVVTKSQIDAGKVNVRYSGTDTSLIKKISIGYESSGSKGAYVLVEFVDELASINSKDFKVNVYLAINNNRSSSSHLVLEGTMENEEVRVNTSSDYVRSSGNRVIVPAGHISSLEFECGDGLFIKTRVYGDRKYYASAKSEITSADEAILSKYPSIDEIITLKTVNIPSGKVVSFEDHTGYHVYDAKYNYLGVTPAAMELSTKYYLSKTKIDMNGSGTGTTSSSSSSSSSSGTTGSSSSTAGTSGEAITVDRAKSLTTQAVNTAKASGSKTASVRVKDASSISVSALQSMNQTATAAGMTVKLNADTMNGTAVSGRLGITPSLASNLTGSTNIQLGVSVNNTTTASLKQKFENWFNNKVVAVSLAQKSSFGMRVEVVVKADLSALNTNNLVFYSYNQSANQYSQISNPSYSIDSNGFLHFYTSAGGEIIITDKALTRK